MYYYNCPKCFKSTRAAHSFDIGSTCWKCKPRTTQQKRSAKRREAFNKIPNPFILIESEKQ